jgi:MFS family permease
MASFAASLGQWMQSTALGWLAFDLTDSRSFVGIVTFMAGVPFLLISLPGGVLIDRFDRRRVLVICQALAAGLAVIVATVVIAGLVEPWHLLIAAFCNGSLQAILSPSQQSLVPSLVPRSSLTNAVGLMSAGNNMTRVFGPSLAGAIIGLTGTGQAFLLQAIAMIAAMGLILTTKFPVRPATVAGSGLRGVLDGLNIVRGRGDLRGLFLLAAIPSFCIFPYISFMPVFAKDVLEIGPQGLGLLMASSGAGAVIGGLMVAGGRQERNMGRMLVAGAICYSLVISIFGLSSAVWLSIPALIVAGLIGSYFMSSNNALIQHRITDDVRGRVMGTYMLTWGLMPLGALPLGILADAIGIQVTTVAGAMITIALTIAATLRNRSILEL